ncbi:MAG: FkbM family methyltransferase [Phycisphaerales bacterium]|nr:FkbM family methyltransferase [Phycisphaerales bacterium]
MALLTRMVLFPLKVYSRIAPTERGGYRLVRFARQFLPRNQWQGTFNGAQGLSFNLDLETYPDCCMAVGLYELDTWRIMRRLLRPGDWFVDCGANIGYFTMLAAKRVGKGGRVDAFEPDPVNRTRLEGHLRQNRLANQVTIHPLAVSNQAGELILYHPLGDKTNHGMSSAYPQHFPQSEQYTVSSVRLDERLNGIPHLIKLDVEGGEWNAIEGMKSLLQSPAPPRLIVEHNIASSSAAGRAPGDLMRLLLALQPRYRIFWIGRSLHPVRSAEELDHFPRQVNLLVETTDRS